VSQDGQTIAFQSDASTLVGATSAFGTDIFVRTMLDGQTRLVSRPSVGVANGSSSNPAVSGDGRSVVFQSNANNLLGRAPVTGPQHQMIFLANLSTGQILAVSGTVNADALNASVSADGQMVAFESQATNLVPSTAVTPGLSRIFIWNRATGTVTTLKTAVGPGPNGDSHHPSLSGDGQLVAFSSTATNFTIETDGASQSNIFVQNITTGETMLVTRLMPGAGSPSGMTSGSVESRSGTCQNPRISSDGQSVTFDSSATNLVATPVTQSNNVFLTDLETGTTVLVTPETTVPPTGTILVTGGTSTMPTAGTTTGVVIFGSTGGVIVGTTGATTALPTTGAGTTGVSGPFPGTTELVPGVTTVGATTVVTTSGTTTR
jgi:Tol biopolymer transport system component